MAIGNMVENRADFGHILAKFNENGKETGSGSPNSDTVRGKPLGTYFENFNTDLRLMIRYQRSQIRD